MVQRSGVIYSNLQIYTHTPKLYREQIYTCSGFLFLTITNNFFPKYVPPPLPASGAVLHNSSSSSSSPVCSVMRSEAGLTGHLDLSVT